MKILLFGASGSGTTTLGKKIEKRLHFKHLDVDDYYWKKTIPPYQEKIPLIERNEHLKKDLYAFDNVVVSGSMVSWGKEWETTFDLAIFIRLENKERMKRLKNREIERYGAQLVTNQNIQQNSNAFLQWANQYENPNFEGRSFKTHMLWIERLTCEVLELDGSEKLSNNVNRIVTTIQSY